MYFMLIKLKKEPTHEQTGWPIPLQVPGNHGIKTEPCNNICR